MVWEDTLSKSTFVFPMKKAFEKINRITFQMKCSSLKFSWSRGWSKRTGSV